MPCVIWYKSEVFCIYRLKVVSVWRQVYASIKFMQAQSLQCQIFGCYIARIRFTVWSHQLTPLEHQQCGTHTWARLRGTHPCSPNRVGRVNSVPLHYLLHSMPPLRWQERVYPTLFSAHYSGNVILSANNNLPLNDRSIGHLWVHLHVFSLWRPHTMSGGFHTCVNEAPILLQPLHERNGEKVKEARVWRLRPMVVFRSICYLRITNSL